jgi:hypothetical protein
MVREYEQITFPSDATTDDIINKIMAMMKGMKMQEFSARPLPIDPIILTYESNSDLVNNTELWKDTCRVCRPIVRDLKVFCVQDQAATFQEQNVFIKWEVYFSKLPSAFPILAPPEPNVVRETDKDDKTGQVATSPTPPEADIHRKEQSSPVETEDNKSGLQAVHDDEADEINFCQFCAYFACLMFDDSAYSFGFSTDGIDDYELDCCCMDSLTESKRVRKVAAKLLGYAEKFGDDAHITFLIQPIDYNVSFQSFGKIRFQAYSHSPSMSQQDLLDILGFRRELVLEVYGIPGEW